MSQAPVIGDYYEGGIVFWVNPDDNNQGLVCDINDLGSFTWCNSTTQCGTSTDILSGMTNTNLMLSTCLDTETAAYNCLNSNSQGYSDWFIPSKDELNLIYLNNGVISTQSVINGGTALNGEYWSSSEHNSGGGDPFWSAWRQTFWNSGFQGTTGKSATKDIRAVREYVYSDPIYGCMDEAACNYNSNANEPNNDLCEYPELYYDCDGSPLNDEDCNDFFMSFDGNSDVNIPHSNSLDFGSNNPMSIMFWLNKNNEGEMHFLGKRSGPSDCTFQIAGTGDDIGIGSSLNWEILNVLYSNSLVNTWNHIAFTYDGNTIICYINGDFIDSVDNVSLGQNTSAPLTLGGVGYGFNTNGFLDDVNLWNIPLSNEQVQQYMNCSPIGNEDGLVGYWSFEEGSEYGQVLDLSQNQNNGVSNNSNYQENNSLNLNCCNVNPYVSGCTDSSAVNFNPDATDDDGSCCYNSIESIWNQLGEDINGQAAGDRSGEAISFNSNGDIVAIGAYGNDGNGNESGHVRVYQNNNGIWDQLGNDIYGITAGYNLGYSLSLSNNGFTLAIGSSSNSSPEVLVYTWDGFSWIQKGQVLDGYLNTSIVSLSADGDTLAIGSSLTYNSPSSTGGPLRVFSFDGSEWNQIGGNMNGISPGDDFGYSVSISDDGSIVAAGAPWNDLNGTDSGCVRVFYLDGANYWIQLGSDIIGENSNDNFGRTVSLNSNGNRIAVGAPYNDGNGDDFGHVRVYENISGSWIQLGQDIDGSSAQHRTGWSVSLSDDGNILSVGYPSGGTNSGGNVQIYEFNSGNWIYKQTINGINNGEQFGYSCALNGNGNIVSVGAWASSINGNSSGTVRVYELESLCSTYLCGDVNLDEQVNSQDAALILQFIVGLIDLDEEQIENGDVNNDDSLNSQDAALILQYIVGLIDEFPGCE